MWYCGGGISHLGTCQCNEVLLADEHMLLEDVSDADAPPAEEEENQDSELESGNEDEGIGDMEDDNDDELILAASNDIDIVAAAGFGALWYTIVKYTQLGHKNNQGIVSTSDGTARIIKKL